MDGQSTLAQGSRVFEKLLVGQPLVRGDRTRVVLGARAWLTREEHGRQLASHAACDNNLRVLAGSCRGILEA